MGVFVIIKLSVSGTDKQVVPKARLVEVSVEFVTRVP